MGARYEPLFNVSKVKNLSEFFLAVLTDKDIMRHDAFPPVFL
jgi:hypothetical protein